MISVPYQYVTSGSHMAAIAHEMINYAKAHPFNHKEMMTKAQSDPSLKTEAVGPMMRVLGTKDVMEEYNRFIAFKNKQDGTIQAIQAAFTIASDTDIRGVRQLTLVESLKQPLDESLVFFIIGYFFEDKSKLMKMDTPAHVRVVFQVPDHDSADSPQ